MGGFILLRSVVVDCPLLGTPPLPGHGSSLEVETCSEEWMGRVSAAGVCWGLCKWTLVMRPQTPNFHDLCRAQIILVAIMWSSFPRSYKFV